MATTTNYGWTTPDDTSLVKDGASAIRTLGSSVDTTTKNLNPETTLGDIAYRSSSPNTNTRLGIGTTGQLLSVSGGVPAWSTVSTGGMTLISTTTLTGASISLSSIPSTYNDLQLVIRNVKPSVNAIQFKMRINGNTGTVYIMKKTGSALSQTFSSDFIEIDYPLNSTTAEGLSIVNLYDYANSVTRKIGDVTSFSTDYANSADTTFNISAFATNQTAAITSLDLFPQSGNWTSGTVLLYGVK
jgi:hypothetical protein